MIWVQKPLERGTPVWCQSTTHDRVRGIVLGSREVKFNGAVCAVDYVVADTRTFNVLEISGDWVFPEVLTFQEGYS